jgi:hypothetical protein
MRLRETIQSAGGRVDREVTLGEVVEPHGGAQRAVGEVIPLEAAVVSLEIERMVAASEGVGMTAGVRAEVSVRMQTALRVLVLPALLMKLVSHRQLLWDVRATRPAVRVVMTPVIGAEVMVRVVEDRFVRVGGVLAVLLGSSEVFEVRVVNVASAASARSAVSRMLLIPADV